MKSNRISAVVIIALIGAVAVLMNLWAGAEARSVPPLEEAAVVTAGMVDRTANRATHHLVEAREGFFLFRAWHWMRYNQLTE